MNILGIQGNILNDEWVNESSASLLIDGTLVGCVAEERLSRVKVDGSFPFKAIDDVLKNAGLTIKDIDYLAVPSLHPAETNKKYLLSAISTFFDTGVLLKNKIKDFSWYYLYN